MTVCNECRKPKECPRVSWDWFAPAEIRFCLRQVQWLVSVLPQLEEGKWPADPSGRAAIGSRHSYAAGFETPVQYAAEIRLRLRETNGDGLVAVLMVTHGWDWKAVEELTGRNEQALEHRTNRVLRYCSGWRRRRITYKEFCSHNRPIVNPKIGQMGHSILTC